MSLVSLFISFSVSARAARCSASPAASFSSTFRAIASASMFCSSVIRALSDHAEALP